MQSIRPIRIRQPRLWGSVPIAVASALIFPLALPLIDAATGWCYNVSWRYEWVTANDLRPKDAQALADRLPVRPAIGPMLEPTGREVRWLGTTSSFVRRTVGHDGLLSDGGHTLAQQAAVSDRVERASYGWPLRTIRRTSIHRTVGVTTAPPPTTPDERWSAVALHPVVETSRTYGLDLGGLALTMVLMMAVIHGARLGRWTIRHRRWSRGICPSCGYRIGGSSRCPECGVDFAKSLG